MWDLLAGYVLEVLGELGKEAFSQVPSFLCILIELEKNRAMSLSKACDKMSRV